MANFDRNFTLPLLVALTASNLGVVYGFSISSSRINFGGSASAVPKADLPPTSKRTNRNPATRLWSEASFDQQEREGNFDLDLALFCGGLAFDAYVEPPSNSSRWERGSKGMDVAFVSNAFTRNLYKGIVEVTPLKAIGLPDEEDNLEGVLSGGGTDACLLTAAIEGQWKEDIQLLEKEQYHEGIFDLTGAAHVGKSSTAWSNVNEKNAIAFQKKTGKGKAYHIPSSWGQGGQAVWPSDEQPYFLYVQDPATVRLIFTLLDDAVVGDGQPIGSTYKRLSDLIPEAKLSQDQLVEQLKGEVMEKIRNGELSEADLAGGLDMSKLNVGVSEFEGTIKLTSKPRIKDKGGQRMMGAMAGAAVAGPLGAAMGAALGQLYEGEVRGRFDARIRYLPFPQGTAIQRNVYTVLGGMPGITWGELYKCHLSERHAVLSQGEGGEEEDDSSETRTPQAVINQSIVGNDLEHCFFIKHAETGGCCAVYRSIEEKVIVVSFRGTCEPVDLITDASVVQVPWVEGEEEKNKDEETIAKVHIGFRKSLNSISRRLKELILATPELGDDISEYDMLVTGHSLGGALATLFVADIGEYGIDAGRALPQLEPSEAWWKSVATVFSGKTSVKAESNAPPRPRSLKMYNFGSPRVGDKLFAARFDELVEDGRVEHAYRLVNGQDIVARLPRSVNAIVGSVGYEHVGSTVLVNSATTNSDNDDSNGGGDSPLSSRLWIEGESDDSSCPVRDASKAINNPLEKGLLADLVADATQKERGNKDDATDGLWSQFSNAASKVQNRLKDATVSDLTSVVGLDKSFTDREFTIIQSFAKGEALAHHMEDEYYMAMGRASGFSVKVGEEIEVL